MLAFGKTQVIATGGTRHYLVWVDVGRPFDLGNQEHSPELAAKPGIHIEPARTTAADPSTW